MFFFISAILYGLKFRCSDEPPICVLPFMKRRILKLGASLWPYLMLLTLLFVIFGIEVSPIEIIANFAFMGYVFKLPGNGHLWFMTILMSCYMMLAFLSKRAVGWCALSGMLIISIIGFIIGEMIGFPLHSLITLALCAILFLNAGSFVVNIRKASPVGISAIVLLINIILLSYYFSGDSISRIIVYPIIISLSISWLVVFIALIPNRRNSVVSFLSSISFELYIVHHTLCQGPFFRVDQLCIPRMFQVLALLVMSIIMANALHLCRTYFYSYLIKVDKLYL